MNESQTQEETLFIKRFSLGKVYIHVTNGRHCSCCEGTYGKPCLCRACIEKHVLSDGDGPHAPTSCDENVICVPCCKTLYGTALIAKALTS